MNQTINNRIDQIKKGQVPVGYENTSFGVFPIEWEKNFLGKICNFIGGGTPPTKKAEYWQGDIPWISSSDLFENNINKIVINRYINRSAIENSATKLCPCNSILLVTRVGVGKLAISKQEICTSQDFTNLINCKCNNYYLAYYLLRKINTEIGRVQGTSIKGINCDEVKKYCVLLPKECEQAKIAEILMKWDEAVELQENYVAKLEIRKKALIQKLLTPKEGWKCKSLENVVEKQKGKIVESSLNGKYPILDMEFLLRGKISNYTNEKGVFAYKNDVLILWDGAGAGSVITGVEGVIGSTFALLKCNDICNRFLYYFLYSVNEKNQKLREGSGVPHVPKDYLKVQKIKCPKSIVEQTKIADILSSADEEISLQKQKLEKLKSQRKSLQQLLLTGIVRVNV